MKKKKSDDAERPPSTPLVEIGLGLAWLLGIAALLQLVELFMGHILLGAALAGAVIADVACTWAGVRWDQGEKRPWKAAVNRLAAGAGVAAAVVAVTFAAGAPIRKLDISAGSPSMGIFLGVLRAASVAIRDELVFRGVPLVAAARAGVSKPIARGFAALAGGAAMVSLPGANPASVALAVASGWLFATLWQRDRGAWSAVGAHAAWALCTGALLRGGIADIAFHEGNFGLGPRASGLPAWIAAAIALLAAALLPRLPGFRAERA